MSTDEQTSWGAWNVSALIRRLGIVMVVCFVAMSTTALAATPEAPVTEAATGVTATEATLHGEVNPGAATKAVKYHFVYSAGPGAECTTSGLTDPAEGPFLEVEGNKQKVPGLALAGLEPNMEYTFCLVAANPAKEAESGQGGPKSFKTLASEPVVDAEGTSVVTPFEGTLEAQVNSNNQETTYEFEYSTHATGEVLDGTVETLPGTEPLLAEFGDRTAFVGTGHVLAPTTTYFYRVVATNGTGTADGKVESFTTPALEAPIVDGEEASNETPNSATLEAQVNPNSQETTYAFEYATTRAAVEAGAGTTTVAGVEPIAASFGDVTVTVSTGETLSSGLTYFYRVVARNAVGTTDGTVQEFMAVDKPLVTSGAVQEVTRSTVTLTAGMIDPVGAATTYSYLYIDQAGYEAGLSENPQNPYAKGASSLPEHELAASFATEPGTMTILRELKPETTYHFALAARNFLGMTIGTDGTFTTGPARPPTASTGGATAVGNSRATVTGVITPNGLETSWELQLGSEAGNYLPVAFGVVGGASGATPVSVELGSLPAGVVFHYRFVATNQDGTSEGTDQSFTTVGLPAALPTPGTPGITFPGFVTTLAERAANEATHESPVTTRSTKLTRQQKLVKALKVCKRDTKQSKSKACEKQARKKYRMKKK
jgi:hypothetical protein